MGNEKVLRERRKESLDKADAIVALTESETRGMTVEEQTDFNAHMAEVSRLEGELDGAQRAKTAKEQLDAAKRYDVPESQRLTADPPAEERRIDVATTRAYEKGDALGAIVAARMRFGAWQQPAAVKWAQQTYGESSPQCRALQQSNFTAGGAFIPENFVGAEFIELLRATARVRQAGARSKEFNELLRATARVRQAGARSITLTNGSATIPKLTGGASGGWIGNEGDNATPSQPTTGQVKMAEKKYMVLVPISNDLRRNSSLETERVVRDDMVRVTANDEDVAFLKGTGLSGQPKGIYYWVGDAGRTDSAGTSLANVRTDIRTAKNRLNTANAPMVRRAWFLHSRDADYMGWELIDGNSNLVFPAMQADEGAILAGARVYRNNNISTVLGSGNKSEVYYVEMSECFIGDNMAMELELIENAVYADASGTLRSGVSRDESVIRLIRKTDFAMRHTESAHVTEAVAWGA